MKLEQAARQLLDCFENGLIDLNAVIALREALAEQAEQEPVGKIVLGQYEVPYIDWVSDVKVEDGMEIYAAPARTKDLTDDEIRALKGFGSIDFARAVIAAFKEKNK